MKRLLGKLKNSVATMIMAATIAIGSGVQASAEVCQLWYVQYDVLTGTYQTCILVREASGPIQACVYSCR